MNILMGGSRQYLSFFYRFEYLDDDFDLPARATIRDILSQVPSHVGFFFFYNSRMWKMLRGPTYIMYQVTVSEKLMLKHLKIGQSEENRAYLSLHNQLWTKL